MRLFNQIGGRATKTQSEQAIGTRLGFAPPLPDHVDLVTLAANTVYRHAVPSKSSFVLAEFESQFFMRGGDVDDDISISGASTTNGLQGESRPGLRSIPSGVTHIIIKSATAQSGSLSFWD